MHFIHRMFVPAGDGIGSVPAWATSGMEIREGGWGASDGVRSPADVEVTVLSTVLWRRMPLLRGIPFVVIGEAQPALSEGRTGKG